MLDAYSALDSTQKVWCVLLGLFLVVGICAALYFIFMPNVAPPSTDSAASSPKFKLFSKDVTPGDLTTTPWYLPTSYTIAYGYPGFDRSLCSPMSGAVTIQSSTATNPTFTVTPDPDKALEVLVFRTVGTADIPPAVPTIKDYFITVKPGEASFTDTNNPYSGPEPGPAMLAKDPIWVTDGKQFPFRIPTYYNISLRSTDKKIKGPPGKTSAAIVNNQGYFPALAFTPLKSLPANYSYVLNKSASITGPFITVENAIFQNGLVDGNGLVQDITNLYTGPPALTLVDTDIKFMVNSADKSNDKTWPGVKLNYAFALVDIYNFNILMSTGQNLDLFEQQLKQLSGPLSNTVNIDLYTLSGGGKGRVEIKSKIDFPGIEKLLNFDGDSKTPAYVILMFRTSNLDNLENPAPPVTKDNLLYSVNQTENFVTAASNPFTVNDSSPPTNLPRSLTFVNTPFDPDNTDKKILPFNTDTYYKLSMETSNQAESMNVITPAIKSTMYNNPQLQFSSPDLIKDNNIRYSMSDSKDLTTWNPRADLVPILSTDRKILEVTDKKNDFATPLAYSGTFNCSTWGDGTNCKL